LISLTHHSDKSEWFPLSIFDGEGRGEGKNCLLHEVEKGDHERSEWWMRKGKYA